MKTIDISKSEQYVSTEPVSLPEAKAWILVDYADDDILITSLMTQARVAMEQFCNVSIVPKSIMWTAINDYCYDGDWSTVSRWDRSFIGLNKPGTYQELPYGPVANVTSVTSIDLGITTILALNADYFVRGVDFKQIKINSNSEQILVQYTTPAYCPQGLKEAILAEIAFAYENRGSGLNRYAAQNVGISERAQSLARPFRREAL